MFLTDKGLLVKNCPWCKKEFIKRRGASCSSFCEGKKLETKHEKISLKMVSSHWPKAKVIVKFPKRLSAKSVFSRRKGWGWTDDIKRVIYIPWYTLRNKKEFFDTMAHELGHIAAFEKKFALFEKKVLRTSFDLWEKYKRSKNDSLFKRLKKHDQEFQEIIDKYLDWEEHDRNPWYREYLQSFSELLNSSFKKYAYGNFKPVPYDLIVKGVNNIII